MAREPHGQARMTVGSVAVPSAASAMRTFFFLSLHHTAQPARRILSPDTTLFSTLRAPSALLKSVEHASFGH